MLEEHLKNLQLMIYKIILLVFYQSFCIIIFFHTIGVLLQYGVFESFAFHPLASVSVCPEYPIDGIDNR